LIWLIIILIVIFILPFFVTWAEEPKTIESIPDRPVGRDYSELSRLDKELTDGVNYIGVETFNYKVKRICEIKKKIKDWDNYYYSLEMYEWKR